MGIAILLAGGSGIRMGTPLPKQCLKIGGMEIWAHTARAFQCSEQIEEIMLVCREDLMEHVRGLLQPYALHKVKQVVAGGADRCLSAAKGVEACQCADNAKVLICDAVRPCITVDVIDRVLAALDSYAFCDTGIPVTETLFEVENGEIVNIPDRSRFVSGQGPEGFHYGLLRDTLGAYLATPAQPMTNISGIVKKLRPDLKIGFVLGSAANIKITTKHDLHLVELLRQGN